MSYTITATIKDNENKDVATKTFVLNFAEDGPDAYARNMFYWLREKLAPVTEEENIRLDEVRVVERRAEFEARKNAPKEDVEASPQIN